MSISPIRLPVPIAIVLALAFAAPAAAAPPQHESSTIVVDAPTENFTCPDGAVVLSTFTVQRATTTYFDAVGDPLRELSQVRYEGRLYSADLSRSIHYAGRIRRVFDFVENTITITGRSAYTPLPDGAIAVTGRRVIDVTTDRVVSESGRPIAEWEARVCSYLYPGAWPPPATDPRSSQRE